MPLNETGKLKKLSLLPSAGDTFSDFLGKLREVSCHLLSKHLWVFIFANMCNCSILQLSKHVSFLSRLAALRPSYRMTFQMVIGSCLQTTWMCEESCGNRAFFPKQRLACELFRGISVKLLGRSENYCKNDWTWRRFSCDLQCLLTCSIGWLPHGCGWPTMRSSWYVKGLTHCRSLVKYHGHGQFLGIHH